MTVSVLKQDPNTKRFKRTLIYLDTDTQYAKPQGNPLCQAAKRHLNNRYKVPELLRSSKRSLNSSDLFKGVMVVRGDESCLIAAQINELVI